MITVKIDVTKIDKKKLFEGKNGAKYIDVALIDTPNDKYGNDYMVVQQTTKEERESGIKGTILGNAKIVGAKSSPSPGNTTAAPSSNSNIDDLPF